MKYIVFLFVVIAAAQTPPPSSNASTLRGKGPCSATVTSDCITSNVGGTVYGGGSGTGDVAGPAASVDSEVAIYSGTGGKILKRFNGSGVLIGVSGVVSVDSGFQFNTTTKALGIFGPIIGGQNSTYQGKLQLRGLTSGVSTLSADADGSGMTLDGRLTVTELVAGTTGANLFTAITAPATPSAGIGAVYVDSTSKNLAVKDDAGVVKHGVQTKTAASNQVLRAIADDGAVTQSVLVAADIPATPLITPGTSITLTGPRAYAVCTGTCTVSVPVPVAGYEFCVMNDNNVATAITLSALGSSAMYENSARTAYGTAGTGTLVLSAAAANRVCIVGRDATHYLTVSYNGTVTVN